MPSQNNLILLKSILFIQSMGVLIYTGFAVRNEGWTLFSVFTKNIASLSWNGQFNLDFSCYLALSGIWIMWRNRFSIPSIFMGFIAMIMGIVVFAPYVLYLMMIEKNDLKKILLGKQIN